MQKLIGKILTHVEVNRNNNDDNIKFFCKDGETYIMHHIQDCCEFVTIEDINGDIDDLIETPIIVSSEVSSNRNIEGLDVGDESFTWTFYKIGTKNGFVEIRWYGQSNGYYSESVTLSKVST